MFLIQLLLISMDIICVVSSFIIISYLQKKPTGLQTLFDKVIIILLYSNMKFVLTISSVLCFAVSSYTMSPFWAKCFFYYQSFISDFYFAWFIVVTLIKYFSIFYPNVVEFNATDTEVCRRLVLFVFIFVVVIFEIEQLFFADVRNFTMFQILQRKSSKSGKQGMTAVTLIVQIFDIGVAIYTYFQIEMKGMNSSMVIEAQSEENNNKSQKLLLRAATLLACIAVCVTIYTVFIVDAGEITMVGLRGSLVIFLYGVVPPFLFISRSSENLKMYAFDCIRCRY